ncbi:MULTISPECIES: ABC transporter ATP-binding protein [Halolamina]|uniref:ATP-binding cassette, subfamily B n=1 Tax=Halolamina pelagica TaxID=699431 RepID=A0A1I5SJT0_9EURY|nr:MULTISPECIES: ABC transporter ATP-binding protein [Halolamina]NHX37029.1 ABC transporter ATP-binding protein [Halolamina sp. R1-12]SFP70942.1 ATP-binding cassette, subfamily B [Halolamina pelagica]
MSDEHGSFSEIRQSVDGHSMKGLLRYCVPYWRRLTVGTVAAFVVRLSRLIPPLLVGVAIDRVIRNGTGEGGLLVTAGLIPSGQITGQAARLQFLEQLVIIAGAAYVVRSLARFASRYLFMSTAQKVQRDLRNDTYDHIQRLSLGFFASHQTGAMMSVLNQDVNRLEQFLNTEIRQAIRVVATVGGIAAIMFWYSPKVAVIALAPVPLIGLASGQFLTWIEPKYRGIRETVSRLNSRLENNLGGARVIKTFNRYDFELDRVSDQSDHYHDEKVGAIKIRRAFFSGLRVITGLVFVAMLWVVGSDIITGSSSALEAGVVATFFMLLRRLYAPMRRVGKTANKYQLAKSSSERVFGILGHEPEVTSPEDAYVPESVEGHVEFDDVTFSYDENETILNGIDLDVETGQTVGLAGTTGAGKSTLLKLLPRFYDVDSGAVRVDGVDVREWDLPRLREHVGIVEQNPYMFSGTAEENIAYGDLSVLSDDDEDVSDAVVDAAKAAEAHEFITDLPEGYETEIGERGVKLSGGQRQRLAIARALLNDPEIVILDEATSDVDTETEEKIQQSLDRLTADRTAFVIAHRLSTIKDADRIVVMENGQVAETGSHDELLREGGDYASLWEMQAGGSVSGAAAADD